MHFKKTACCLALLSVWTHTSFASELENDDTEIISVTGTFSSNIIKALDDKKYAENVVDVILAEDIGKFPDLTTSDALQRIPGVQVARGAGEANGVVVRGLPDVKTTINGRSIFSTTSRGFAFQDLPAEALSSVSVYKSRSAEQLEGGIAGLVNIELRKPLQFDGFKLATSARITDDQYADGKDKVISGLLSNRWTLSTGEFGALFNISKIEDNFQQSNTFSAETLATDRTPDGTTVGIPLSVGIVSDKGIRERMQANFALQFMPNETTEFYLDGLHSSLDHQQHTIFGIGFLHGNDIVNITMSDNDRLCNNLGASAPVCYVASGTAKGSQFLAGTHAVTSDVGITQVAAGLKWNNANDIALKSEFVVTDTERQYANFIQDWHYYGVDVNFVSNDNNHTNFNIEQGGTLDPDNFVSGGLFQPWDDSEGKEFAWSTDAEYLLDMGAFNRLDVGFRYADRKAHFRAADLAAFSGGGRPASDFGDNYLVPVDMGGATYLDLPGYVAADYEYMLANKNKIRAVYGLMQSAPEADPIRAFDAQEKSAAIYAQTKYETELNGMLIKGAIGTRVVQIEREMSSFGLVDGQQRQFVDESKETDILPNASANMHFSEQTILRSSVSKTISRPAFGDLNPNLFYTPPAPGTPFGYGNGGNPDLDPIESLSYDISLEYYPSDGGIASLALFYRDIKGYISTFSREEQIEGQTYYISRPFSSGEGYLEGAEVAFTKFFKTLPEPFDGLGVQLNYTYIDGEVSLPDGEGSTFQTPLSQVSKHNGNAVLMYEADKVFARLAYNYRGNYIETFAAPGIQTPKTSVVRESGRIDASLGYNISKNLTISIDGTNLNNETFQNYWGLPERSRDRRDPGRTISIGIAYQM